MKVVFFYRNRKAGFSIAKVFNTIADACHIDNRIEVPRERCSLLDIFINTFYVFTKRSRGGINHVTGDIHYTLPALLGQKSILTVHDTSSYDCASSFVKRFIIKYLWHVIPYRCASKIVCISEETRRSVLRFTKRKDILVIYNPVDPSIHFDNKLFVPSNLRFLIIGTAWNKNIENTLKAIDGIEGTVTIVGKLNVSQNMVANGLRNLKVITKLNLSDNDIIEEYKKCDIVLFCTIYEGFGMPIIEAQKVGRAIVTSNIEPHKEIAGEGALFVDPYNITSIKTAVHRIIHEEGLYDALVKKGLDNVKRFDAYKIANDYNHLYNSL